VCIQRVKTITITQPRESYIERRDITTAVQVRVGIHVPGVGVGIALGSDRDRVVKCNEVGKSRSELRLFLCSDGPCVPKPYPSCMSMESPKLAE